MQCRKIWFRMALQVGINKSDNFILELWDVIQNVALRAFCNQNYTYANLRVYEVVVHVWVSAGKKADLGSACRDDWRCDWGEAPFVSLYRSSALSLTHPEPVMLLDSPIPAILLYVPLSFSSPTGFSMKDGAKLVFYLKWDLTINACYAHLY